MNRLEEIASEMIDLIDAPDIFTFFDDSAGNMDAVEKRLQEVMMGRPQFQTEELAMYLRATGSRQAHLPTWQPLLNATIEIGKMRGDDIDDMLYGLMPQRPAPKRNTGRPV